MPTDEPLRLSYDSLSIARRQLLDLSTRNRMIDAKLDNDRAKRVDIIEEQSVHVFEILVKQRQSMSFEPMESIRTMQRTESYNPSTESALAQAIDSNKDLVEAQEKSWKDRKLQTKLTLDKLQTRLLDLSFDAQTYIQEQGINTLFLALGFLKWNEAETSPTVRYAPLLLIPVSLSRSSVVSQFKLRANEEDLIDNLSLQAKLKSDFGIELPLLPVEKEELDIERYFDSVRRVIAGKRNWEIQANRITISFFSFAKLLMHQDLDAENWPEENGIDQHPMVQGLLGAKPISFSGPLCDEDQSIDRLIPSRETFHVLEADSSQSVVIEEARRGRSMVVQGPPGTGKSQTIANILATAVADGKRVLFVAEKLAALEVVKLRLDNLDLGSLCLELHSNKANKQAVIRQIEATLLEGAPRYEAIDELVEELDRKREELNEYTRLLNSQVNLDTGSVLLESCDSKKPIIPRQILAELSRLEALNLPMIDLPEKMIDDWSIDTMERKIPVISEWLQSLKQVGTVKDHPWYGAGISGPLSQTDLKRVQKLIDETENAILSLEQALGKLASHVRVSSLKAENLHEARTWHLMVSSLISMPTMDRQTINSQLWNDSNQLADINRLILQGISLQKSEGQRQNNVDDRADFVKVKSTIEELAKHHKTLEQVQLGRRKSWWWRVFSKAFRSHLREFKTLSENWGNISPRPWNDDLSDDINQIIQVINYKQAEANFADQKDQFDAKLELGKQSFGLLWLGIQSEWEQLKRIVEWQTKTRETKPLEVFWKLAARWIANPDAVGAVDLLDESICNLRMAWENMFKFLQLDQHVLGALQTDRIRFEHFRSRRERWTNETGRLQEWAAFNRKTEVLNSQELGEVVLWAYSIKSDSWDQIPHLIRHAVHEKVWQQIDQALRLSDHGREKMETLIERFRSLDVERIRVAKSQVALSHYKRIPRDSELGEMRILKGEINKKRGHKPIRRLMEEAGSVVQMIKPIFMMSPMSIAQYLKPGAIAFDVVVIDEASQVAPEDALGAMARSKQVIVVGDSKQMPPTSFFSQSFEQDSTDSDIDAETTLVSDYESVLDICKRAGFPERMLRWHYRSQHHSLIAVSNREFYDNKLFVVPSPDKPRGDFGLHFEHVPTGSYDRGKSATNRIEAGIVAKAVMEHAGSYPNRSLGVGCFSVAQRDAIRDELELLRKKHPDLEGFFQNEANEPFFIKNLENIQGDERDVILISVGYGRDAHGSPNMSFGPLNNDGGERRLNVLISRSRQKCVVYSSIRAADMNVANAKHLGVKVLKTFLKYAETGEFETITTTNRGFDSVFEEQVSNVVGALGYECHSQIGSESFRIDLGVVNPNLPGTYVLGIECDGASYHSSRSARDRDRLRESILRKRGWEIHRIWSTEWFYNQESEVLKLRLAIENAITKSHNQSQQGSIESEFNEGSRSSSIEREREAPRNATDLTDAYIEADFSVQVQAIANVAPIVLANHLKQVIEIEGPIHRDEAFRRLITLYGQSRMGTRIQSQLNDALDSISGSLERDLDFLKVRGRALLHVRNRQNVNSPNVKKPSFISMEEFTLAISQVINENAGLERSEVYSGVVRLLGLSNVTTAVKESIDPWLDRCIASGSFEQKQGRFYKVS
jgi:hypothetical protein